jgi:DNA-binding NtrC family response regulator
VSKRRVLVVEDDHDLRRTLARCLVREGCEVTEARDGQEAVDQLAAGHHTDLIVTDLEMPRADGHAVLAAGLRRRVPVVILTGQATVETAVQMMREGAANFLTKPFSPASLRSVLDDTFGRKSTAPAASTDKAMIGEVPPFRRVLDAIDSVAETEATVLLTGESGTGKEVVARTIHNASRRASGPFVAVNCGAIPEALLESELFGHAKGAFTGATHSRAGRFALAEGGTLLLDEIGDMPLGFQVKLLRVLQERQVEVLGEGVSRPVDVRVIAATHRDLPAMVGEGAFRQDLYYRLNVIEMHLPPLRERKGDIPLLVEHFLQAANARHSRQVRGVTAGVLQLFEGYAWPGNIRQLANVIERMVVLRRSGDLDVGDLPPEIAAPPTARSQASAALPQGGIDLRQAVAELEDSLIAQALARTGGNRNAAAQLLGLNRTTLVEKLKRRKDPPSGF